MVDFIKLLCGVFCPRLIHCSDKKNHLFYFAIFHDLVFMLLTNNAANYNENRYITDINCIRESEILDRFIVACHENKLCNSGSSLTLKET